jgi:phosphoribosylformylglycinamidine synthase
LRVKDHGDVVAEIPNSLLTDDAPLYDRTATEPFRAAPLDGPVIGGPGIGAADGPALADALRRLLSSADICSKRWIYEQYDHMVRTNTTLGPGADAAVVRIKEAGVSLAMALDGNGRYASLDPKEGAKLAVAECCRNLATVGATPLGTTNCLNFGNPEKPEIMAQLVAAIEGMGEACRHFGAPITGGNVSLYNETLGRGILPTPVVGVVGLLGHVGVPVGIHFRQPGRKLVVLGGLLPGWEGEDAQLERRFGSTQYAKVVAGQAWGLAPLLDMDYEKRLHDAVREVVCGGWAESVHDVSDGGLAVAAAECSFGPETVGARLELELPLDARYVLFHEAPSRVVVSTTEEQWPKIRDVAHQHHVEAAVVGMTIPDHLEVYLNRSELFRIEIRDLYERWDKALEEMLEPR